MALCTCTSSVARSACGARAKSRGVRCSASRSHSRQSAAAGSCAVAGERQPSALSRCSSSQPLLTGWTAAGKAGGRTRTSSLRVNAVVIDEDDLMQFEDRVDWYEAKFAAEDMPEWSRARFVRSADVAPGLRSVTLEIELSRERVALRNAYKTVGQRAQIRVNNGYQYELTVASPPHSLSLNKEPIFKIRGDLFAHQIKTVVEATSVMGEIDLLVSKEEAPEVFNLTEDDEVEAGPFLGTGIDLRGSQIQAMYRYPTVVLLAEGKGIAAARALVETPADGNGLQLQFRQNTVLYYKVPNDASICFRERFSEWEQLGCRVVTTTGSFQDAFDDDDLLEYDPDSTAAIILTAGDVEATKAARALCAEAEISLVLSDDQEQAAPVYHSATPKGFQRWSKKKTGVH